MKKYAVIMTTYNRTLDAKINMEIIRCYWSKVKCLSNLDLYHAYNGKKEWYRKKYLEDYLIRRINIDHYSGAADLIDSGMKKVFRTNIHYKYIIVLSSDVFIINPERLEELLSIMERKKYLISTSLWPSFAFIPKYFSSEFFIISMEFAKKIFPLNLRIFFKARSIDNLLYTISGYIPVLTVPKVELCITTKVLDALNLNFWGFNWLKYIYLIPERKIVWAINRNRSNYLEYYSDHNLNKKVDLICSKSAIKKIVGRTKYLRKIVAVNSKRYRYF